MAQTDAYDNPLQLSVGDTLDEDWHQAVPNRVIPVYPNNTQRDNLETSPSTGRVVLISGSMELQTYDGSGWVVIHEAGPRNDSDLRTRPLAIASSAPSSPETGDLWIDTSGTNALKRYSGSTWDTLLTSA